MRLGARNRGRRAWQSVEKHRLKVISCLAAFWVFGVYFRQFIPFPVNKHRIQQDDLNFEISYAKNGRPKSMDGNGFLRGLQASKYCNAHNWKPFPRRDTRRKIFDLVMVNTELDWLEIRLNELHDHVDYFVVLESATTFTGHPKPLAVKENWARFAKYNKQIIYHLLENPPISSNNSWDHERHQRNAMFTQVLPYLNDEQAPNIDDVILVSDLDEIPRPVSLILLRNCEFPRFLTLRSRFYYYSFQWLHRGREWAHPQATTYQGPNDTVLPADLRGGRSGFHKLENVNEKADLWNAAWHCSSCFSTIEEMLTKMSSFSHTELNKDRFREKARIVERIRNGKDLWDRSWETYDRIDNNQDVPRYIKENGERFEYMLDRDSPNAGFVDYRP